MASAERCEDDLSGRLVRSGGHAWIKALRLAAASAAVRAALQAHSSGAPIEAGPTIPPSEGCRAGHHRVASHSMTGHHLPTGTLRSVLRYPHCGFSREQTMPTDACLYFYECTQCRHNAQRPGRSCCWSPRGCWCTLKRRLTPDRIERRVPGRPRPLTSVTASLPRHSPCAPAPHPACSIAARSSSASHLTQVAIRPRKTSFSPMMAARPHAASGRVGSALSQAK